MEVAVSLEVVLFVLLVINLVLTGITLYIGQKIIRRIKGLADGIVQHHNIITGVIKSTPVKPEPKEQAGEDHEQS